MRANGSFRCAASAAIAAFAWAIVVSAWPGLHDRIHPDQNRGEHSCIVTVVRAGSCHHAAAPTLVSIAEPATEFATLPELTPCWVASPFLNAAVFEHAPPART
jgi:hypothetical protein